MVSILLTQKNLGNTSLLLIDVGGIKKTTKFRMNVNYNKFTIFSLYFTFKIRTKCVRDNLRNKAIIVFSEKFTYVKCRD